jgi:hypothetical protein
MVATVSHGTGATSNMLAGLLLVERVDHTVRAVRTTPGIADVAAGLGTGSLLDIYSSVGGARLEAGDIRGLLMPARVTHNYFDVVGTRVLAGRPFAPADRGRPVVVVNQAFAARFFPGESGRQVVGRTLTVNLVVHDVIGLVQNVHDRSLDQPPAPKFYQTIEAGEAPFGRVNYAIHSSGPVNETALQRAIASADPDAVLETLDSLDGRLAEGIRDRTFATIVLGLFGAAGLGVTAMGIFAIVAFVVARRTREIAVRMAIGASAYHIRRLVMRDATIAMACGAVIGFLVASAGARLLESYLFGVTAGDLGLPILAALGLFAVTGLAAWWPTRRALRLEPTIALREE